MELEEIDASAGIREVVIHPIHGLLVEYLSPSYFERCRHALARLKAQGLRVWIYDECAPESRLGKFSTSLPGHATGAIPWDKASRAMEPVQGSPCSSFDFIATL
jgi:hypothetical protein